jgi:hypothetical protein
MTSPLKRHEEGAALLEFAVVLPILLALLLGIVTSGTALNSNNSMNNAARESARFGATLPADNLTWWLNKVAEVAVDSATGELEAGSDGRYICVAYVHPNGTAPSSSGFGETEPTMGTDHTVRLEIDEDGVKTISIGQSCYSDGRPSDERRVQVLVERDADLEFVFFERTVTLNGQSTARFERAT